MNIMPFVAFYGRRHEQITELLAKHKGSPQGSPVLDLVNVIVPVVKIYWPQLNDKGILDDLVETMNQAMGGR